MTSVYDLAAELRALVDSAEADDGEVSGDVSARLDALGGELAERLDGIASAIADIEAHAERLEHEAKRLRDRAAARRKRAERLREYAQACLAAIGQRKLRTERWTLSISATPPRVVFDAECPRHWCVEELRPERARIAEHLRGGATLPWAHLEVGETLRIR